jgi:hypothetical protein
MAGSLVMSSTNFLCLKWSEVDFGLTVSRPVRLGVRNHFGAHDQMFLFHSFCQTIALFFLWGVLSDHRKGL